MEGYKDKVARLFLSLFLIASFLLPLVGSTWLTTESFAAVFNVTNSTGLQNALDTAGSNGQDDTINIATGMYGTDGSPFTYTPDPERELCPHIKWGRCRDNPA